MPNPFTNKARKNKLKPFGKKKSAGEPKPSANPFTKRARRDDATGPQTTGFLHPGSEKADFRRSGIAFVNPRDHGGYWSVDVVNGDDTYTFHNRYGSWFMQNGRGMVEPQREVAFGLQDRYIAELKRIGAELPFHLRTEQDKRDKRNGTPKKERAERKQPAKTATKVNPWTARKKK